MSTTSKNNKSKCNSCFKDKVEKFIYNERFNRFIITVILINAVALGLLTYKEIESKFGELLHYIDYVCVLIFIVEISGKLYVKSWQFFKNPWNIFDFVIVMGSIVVLSDSSFSVLRSLRILRVLRLISSMPQLRGVINGLLSAIPGISAIALLLVIIYYVAAVIATNLFGNAFPDWFGDLGNSAYTLFQIMTLESWSMGIVRPVMVEYPHAWLFFVLFILISSFTMLNLFIAVIISAMEATSHKEEEAELQQIKKMLKDIQKQLDNKKG